MWKSIKEKINFIYSRDRHYADLLIRIPIKLFYNAKNMRFEPKMEVT